MKENSAKNFVIQLGSLIALYVSVSALLVLLFGVINLRFPDEISGYWADESAREGIRLSIAMLAVFFPTYLVLTRMSNQIRRKEENGAYTGLSKWLIYLSLLVGGAIILGDLVTVLLFFLNGEITARFILKALALFSILSLTFGYYSLDLKGYFKSREKLSIQYGVGALVLVLAALVLGFFHIETPAEVREMKLDEQQVTDLQQIQYRIEEYHRVEGVLPVSIESLYEEMDAPEAPAGRQPYTYTFTGSENYQLCASFLHPSAGSTATDRPVPVKDNYSWEHLSGNKCFERVVTSAE